MAQRYDLLTEINFFIPNRSGFRRYSIELRLRRHIRQMFPISEIFFFFT